MLMFQGMIDTSSPTFLAFAFGICSALSLPIGAICGLIAYPASDIVVARLMSFGAGALLFAVTIEMYGEQIFDLHSSVSWENDMQVLLARYPKIGLSLVSCVIGAWLYYRFNIYLQQLLAEEHTDTLEAAAHHADPPWTGDADDPRHQDDDMSIAGRKNTTNRSQTYCLSRQKSRTAVMERMALSFVDPSVTDSGSMRDHLLESGKVSSRFIVRSKTCSLREGSDRNCLAFVFEQSVPQISKMSQSCPLSGVSSKDEGGGASGKKFGVAFAIILGVIVDGLAEGVLIAFLAAHHKLSVDFVFSIFLANFPEAFSSSSMLLSGEPKAEDDEQEVDEDGNKTERVVAEERSQRSRTLTERKSLAAFAWGLKLSMFKQFSAIKAGKKEASYGSMDITKHDSIEKLIEATKTQTHRPSVIVGLWFVLCLLTGCIAGSVCFILSHVDIDSLGVQLVTGVVEGMAAGAMLMMILSVMVPEAFDVQKEMVGIWMILGFVVSISITVFAGYVDHWGVPRCFIRELNPKGDGSSRTIEVLDCN